MRTILIMINEMKTHSLPINSSTKIEPLDTGRPLPAEKLLNLNGYVQIAFKGQIYTLRQTRNDKLILTK